MPIVGPHLGQRVDHGELGLELPHIPVAFPRLHQARVHHFLVEGLKGVRVLGHEGLGDRNAALCRQLVGVSFVDEALDNVGLGTGDDVVPLEGSFAAGRGP